MCQTAWLMFLSQALLKMLFVFCPGKCGSAIFPCIPAKGPSAVATHAKRMPAAGRGSSWLLAAQLLVLDFFIRSVARRIPELGAGYSLAQSLCWLSRFPTAVRTSSFPRAAPRACPGTQLFLCRLGCELGRGCSKIYSTLTMPLCGPSEHTGTGT